MARTLSAGLAIAAALCVAGIATPSAAATFEGYSTANVNQRTGPSVGYPVIQVIPANARVRIYGCLTGVTWCDTSFAGRRGWVSSRYLQIYGVNRQPRPIVRFGFSSGLPLIAPWWDRPTNHRRPRNDHNYHPGNNNDNPPPFPPGGHNNPPGGPGPGVPPNGNYHPPHDGDNHPPMCGVPGKPPCPPNNCGGPGKPPCPPM